MSDQPLTFPADPNEQDLARLYSLQVRELQDFAIFLATLTAGSRPGTVASSTRSDTPSRSGLASM